MTTTRIHLKSLFTAASLLALVACQNAQDIHDNATPTEKVATPTSEPAPAPITRNPDKTAFFGDLHVHTRNSFDAFIFGTRADADAAYRFAKGETIDNGVGHNIQLDGPPLDFLSVTDHGEYMGIVPAMRDSTSHLSKTKTAKSIFGLLATDRRANFLKIGTTVVTGEEIEEIYDRDYMDAVWAKTVEATEQHNQPGQFTTFAGYEFTAMTQVTDDAAANLHRNVIFKDSAPDRLFTTLDSPNPEDLWSWMNDQRETGHDVLAIPHNSNASNGQMFAATQYDGTPLTQAYAENRLRNEPIVEMTQLKGTSETHPTLSPNDEWADFELYDVLIGSTMQSTPAAGSFVRQSLARGIGLEGKLNANPYAFGFIGSSDTHIGAASLSEETHFGKFPHDVDPANRQSTPPEGASDWRGGGYTDADLIASPQYGASGLAGVWAEANTRADLFAAMRARETFATSGPRIKIRLFAGGYTDDILSAPDMISRAYAEGIAMGGHIQSPVTAPTFLAWALQDPNGMSFQRLQMVKVWSEDGGDKEALYDIACAGGAEPDPQTHRCPDNGARVDISTCQTSADHTASEFKTLWQDTDYNAGQSAAYYLRVLENPKCRWSTWDAVRNGTPPSPEMHATVQDRAWSSTVWVKAEQRE